jgi:hypothetical protein
MTLLPFRLHDDDRSPVPADATTDALRAEYAAPGDGYWDALETRVLSAVARAAGRPARLEWWQALAGWSRPVLAAAAVALLAAGAAALQARDARAHVAFQAVLDDTPLEAESVRLDRPRTLSEVDALLRAGVQPDVRAESAATRRASVSDEVLRYVQPE